MLFKSVLSSVPHQESKWSIGKGLESVPELVEDHKHAGDNDDSGAQSNQPQEPQVVPGVKCPVLSPQLFSSLEEPDIGAFGKPGPGQQPRESEEGSQGVRSRRQLQNKTDKNTEEEYCDRGISVDEPTDRIQGIPNPSIPLKAEQLEVSNTHKDLHLMTPKIKLPSTVREVHQTPLVAKFLKSMNIESPVIRKISQSNIEDPSDENEFKSGLAQNRLSLKSHGSHFSGKSSGRSDTCTSTPLDSGRHIGTTRKRSQRSEEIFSLEEEDLKAPKNNSLITLNESSVFKSPVSVGVQNVASSNGMQTNPSLGSKYETCMTSDHCIQTDSLDKEKEPSRNCITTVTHYKRLTKGRVPSVEVEKTNFSHNEEESCNEMNLNDSIKIISEMNLNDSIKIINEKFKKTLESLSDPTEITKSETSSQTSEKDLQSEESVNQQDTETSPVLTNFMKRKTKGIQKPVKRLESSKNLPLRETSVASSSQRNSKRISSVKMSCHKLHRKSLQSDHSSAKELSDIEESLVLVRQTRFVDQKRCQQPVRFSKRLSNKANKAESRTSKRLAVKKCKQAENTFNNANTSDSWTSKQSVSKVLSDEEQSPVFITRKVSNRARHHIPTVSPVLTRGQMASRQSDTILLESTHKRYDLQTRRSSRLSLRGYTATQNDRTGDLTKEFATVRRMSKSSNTINYRRRKKKAGKPIFATDPDQNIYHIPIPESLVEQEEPLASVLCTGVPDDVQHKYECSTSETNNQSASSVTATDRNSSISYDAKTEKTSTSVNDSVSITQQWNTTEELDDECGSLPLISIYPAKCGKGWRRSAINMCETQQSSNGQHDDVRRQTVHHMLGGKWMAAGLRISAIPEEINMRIQQMGENSPRKAHNQSHLQLPLSCEMNDSLFQQVPANPREDVLHLCDQEKPVPLTDCFTDNRLACCKKIGEGVYGEVFMTKPNPQNLEGATVLKIMPIEGTFSVNGEPQKKFGEIISEIIISMELSNLRNPDQKSNSCETFVQVLSCWCVEGSYHPSLLNLWDVFHEEKGSENDRPHIFPDYQLYIVLEFGHGGQDLESFVFSNAKAALAVFLQIVYSLAVAERELEFEHRDLHWGNVLVAQTDENFLDFKINNVTYTLPTNGLKATVIDFTLSRMKLPHCIMFNNLAEDPSLFIAEGDYQYEIYRQMRKATKNEWKNFTPYTNVLWLHYILDKMTTDCYFKNVKTKVHKTHHAQLTRIKDNLLQCASAEDFVLRWEEGNI